MHQRDADSVLLVVTLAQYVHRNPWTFVTFCRVISCSYALFAKSAFYCCHACLPPARLSACPSISKPVSVPVTVRLPLEVFPWNLTVGTSRKICPETPNILVIRQKYRAVYDATSTFLYCRQYELAIKVLICNTQYFISLAVAFTSTMNRECSFSFTLQQWSGERSTVLRYAYIKYIAI